MRSNGLAAIVAGATIITAGVLAVTGREPGVRETMIEQAAPGVEQMAAASAEYADTLNTIYSAQAAHFQYADETTALYGELIDITDDGGVLKLNAAPVRYRAADGTLQAIDTAMTQYENGALVNVTNTVKSTLWPDGTVSLQYPDGTALEYAPVAVDWIGDAEPVKASGVKLEREESKPERVSLKRDNIRETKRGVIRAKREAHNKAVIRDLFPNGTRLERTVLPGEVKENIILETKPDIPRGATHMAVVNQWKAEGCTLSVDGSGALVVERNGKRIATMPPMPVVDAKRNKSQTSYAVDGNTFSVLTDADFLRKAVYPVDIDPTLNSSPFTAAIWTHSSSYEEWGGIFYQIDMPAITGTVSQIDIVLTNAGGGTSGDTLEVDCQGTSYSSWTESSYDLVTLYASAFTWVGAYAVFLDSLDGAGHTYTIRDENNSGTVYGSTCNPGYYTFHVNREFDRDQGDEIDTGGGDMQLFWDTGNYSVEIAGYANVTTAWRPYLVFTYSGSLGCAVDDRPRHSGAAGVLIF